MDGDKAESAVTWVACTCHSVPSGYYINLDRKRLHKGETCPSTPNPDTHIHTEDPP